MPENARLLGKGGAFERPEEGFQGWACPDGGRSWNKGVWLGRNPNMNYAIEDAPEKIDNSQAEPRAWNPGNQEDVLEEAYRITSGDRQNQYGPPEQDFTRTAAMWSALFADKLSRPFEARDVAMAMICLKLSRETHQRKRDNAVDGAGYFRCLHICNEAQP